MRRWILWAHVAVGALIALGALGHSGPGAAPVQAALGPAVPPPTTALVLAVWHFAGLCMVLLGALVAWNGWQHHRAAASLLPSGVIGLAYAGYGAAVVALTGQRFFWVFVVLGVALLGCVAGWRGAGPAPAR